ncbi:guanyl-nucleotide exchange factor [Diplodia corticola]|uniref:Guanyl-nucleotide exchange factor n=1 Tax=Diplodia corticola TaxID=236234 RepID=A0A1J9RU81_9PEZI|nr:guanyl-nucleotide exchange factor [Diplodia corticola]OJD36131.1 guanyl-nucleotide exchange factor [Diplodia corticola]
MPLRGLRPGRSEKDLKRRSTLDPSSIFKREQASRAQSAVDLAPNRGIQSSDGSRPNHFDPRVSWAGEPPPSPPIQEHNAQTRRFSMLKFRHASDPQLSQKAKEHAQMAAARDAPPVPAMPAGNFGAPGHPRTREDQTANSRPLAAPAIITTAPTMEPPANPPPKKKTKFPTFRRRLSFEPAADSSPRKSSEHKRSAEHARPSLGGLMEARPSQEDPARLSVSRARDPAAENGHSNAGSQTALGGRLSDSSRSDASSNDHVQLATHKRPLLTSHSTIFRLPRRNKEANRKSLFPLPARIPAPPEFPDTAPATPRASTSGVSVNSPHHSPDGTYSPPLTAVHRSNTDGSSNPSQPSSHSALSSAVNGTQPDLLRNDSTNSARSARSSHSLAPPAKAGLRNRSNTMGSLGGKSDDDPPPTPPHGQDGRLSTSTTGRASFSNLFHLGNRFRQNTEPNSPRRGSPGVIASGRGSHSTSLNISREALVIPEKEEGETPGRYLERLEENIDRSLIASIVAKHGDEYSLAVLRSYMRRFMFFGDPIDMALRKLLMEVELPKETQQIDRVLQGFADRYHECNPGLFVSPEEAYFISFSIVLLNSDFFNPNNKRKMQKPDYIKNCNGGNASEVNDDVLATLYDNIVYTQFIHIDDEVDLRSLANRRSKKTKIIKNAVQDPVKKAQKEPVDPYTIIFENKLDILRPPIREVMQFEDPYSYKGTAQCIDLKSLHVTFARYGVIQIVSARSRPEAFMSPTTIENPDGAQAGVVEMPVTKVGILWRKDSKKKAARSPWQEWGAVLTRSSLSFFKNASWAKSLIHQHDSHEKAGGAGNPVVFRPPVEEFKPDYAIPMDQCVAASDSSYRKHKYAFVIFAKGGAEEVFLADDEADMNDWLAKLNYTAAFETAGIRPRGLIGGSYDGQRNRAIRRLESSQSAKSIQGPTGQVTFTSGKIDNQLAQQIVKARRENIQRKVEEADDRLGAAVKQLDSRLRDARHLQVMAPIQPRTREHVMHAAGRMAAKLKWIRIEIVRMKAHRDILIMDMDEEKKMAIDAKRAKEMESIPPVPALPPAASSPTTVQGPKSSRLSGLVRLGSKASGSTTRPRSPRSPSMTGRPDTSGSDIVGDDVFTTPPETTQPSPGSPPAGWDIPPMKFGPSNRDSWAESTNSSRPGLEHRPSVSTVGDRTESVDESDAGSRHRRLSVSDAERNPSEISMNLDGRPSTPAADDVERPAPGSPESRSKVRRSLHRTLRDTHSGSGHRRSGKGKESGSSVKSDDLNGPSSPEVFPRAHQSFTVHGKKASVVTFGAEWQNLSAEERLRLRKSTTDDGGKLNMAVAGDDDATIRGRGRAASATSESSRTIRNLAQGPGPTLEEDEKQDGLGLKPLPKDVQWDNGRLSEEMADSGLASEPEDLSPTTTRDSTTKAVGDDEDAPASDLHKNAQPQAVEA